MKSALLRRIDDNNRPQRSTIALEVLETMYKNNDEESRVANIQENPMHTAMMDIVNGLQNENKAQREVIEAAKKIK